MTLRYKIAQVIIKVIIKTNSIDMVKGAGRYGAGHCKNIWLRKFLQKKVTEAVTSVMKKDICGRL